MAKSRYINRHKGRDLDKAINWNEEKNQLLKLQRGVDFEMVLDKLLAGEIVASTTPLIKRCSLFQLL